MGDVEHEMETHTHKHANIHIYIRERARARVCVSARVCMYTRAHGSASVKLLCAA